MDERELIIKAKAGDENSINALLNSYKGLVDFLSRKYFLTSAQFSDIVQEGMIGLFNAYRTFNVNGSTSFRTYATVCIRRQIQTMLAKNSRAKDVPLNTYVSINNQGKVLFHQREDGDDVEDDDIGFYIEAETLNPEEKVLFKEHLSEMSQDITRILSPYERKVLGLFMQGINYAEIARLTAQSTKSVDNALSRIKSKLKKSKEER